MELYLLFVSSMYVFMCVCIFVCDVWISCVYETIYISLDKSSIGLCKFVQAVANVYTGTHVPV